MALSFIMRRASSPVLPLAIRAVGSPRAFHKAITNILNSSELNKDSKYNIQVVKKLADDNLLRAIDTIINSKEHEQYEIPKKFPFDIVKDNYSENGTIKLKREYFNELIKVEVDLAAANERDEDKSGSDSDDDKDKGSDSESNSSSDSDNESNTGSDTDAKRDESRNDSDDSDVDNRVHIPLTVKVSKGSNISLEVLVKAFPDEISIEHLLVEVSEEVRYLYIPPEFWHLDDTMKDALHRYLEVRGIDVSMANVLHKYWEHKENQDKSTLKKIKKFIKK